MTLARSCSSSSYFGCSGCRWLHQRHFCSKPLTWFHSDPLQIAYKTNYVSVFHWAGTPCTKLHNHRTQAHQTHPPDTVQRSPRRDHLGGVLQCLALRHQVLWDVGGAAGADQIGTDWYCDEAHCPAEGGAVSAGSAVTVERRARICNEAFLQCSFGASYQRFIG